MEAWIEPPIIELVDDLLDLLSLCCLLTANLAACLSRGTCHQDTSVPQQLAPATAPCRDARIFSLPNPAGHVSQSLRHWDSCSHSRLPSQLNNCSRELTFAVFLCFLSLRRLFFPNYPLAREPCLSRHAKLYFTTMFYLHDIDLYTSAVHSVGFWGFLNSLQQNGLQEGSQVKGRLLPQHFEIYPILASDILQRATSGSASP